ncbi:hypothetical protein C8Q78DRAFT_1075004 [Trametes maxima]|nr:hypothetical protein C8Q78DRAFT_1075004 [Trametes maxima]
MTNLVIKGIIGVAAMSKISWALGEDEDARQLDSASARLIGSRKSNSFSQNQQRLLGTYGDTNSWALLYNLYADQLLETNLVDYNLLQLQTAFYQTLLNSSSASQFGIAIDNTIQQASVGILAWALFTAATVTDNGVRDRIIDGVWNRASSNKTPSAFPDHYQLGSGDAVDGIAGPAAGAIFSLLALNVSSKNISITPSIRKWSKPLGIWHALNHLMRLIVTGADWSWLVDLE